MCYERPMALPPDRLADRNADDDWSERMARRIRPALDKLAQAEAPRQSDGGAALTPREQKLDAILRQLADQRTSLTRDRATILQSWLDRGPTNAMLRTHVIAAWREKQTFDPESAPESRWPQPKRRWWSWR